MSDLEKNSPQETRRSPLPMVDEAISKEFWKDVKKSLDLGKEENYFDEVAEKIQKENPQIPKMIGATLKDWEFEAFNNFLASESKNKTFVLRNKSAIIQTACVVYDLIERQSKINNAKMPIVSEEVLEKLADELAKIYDGKQLKVVNLSQHRESRGFLKKLRERIKKENPVIFDNIKEMIDSEDLNSLVKMYMASTMSLVYELLSRQAEFDSKK